MLVIVSDLHLTDGTLSESLHPGAFRVFIDSLRQRALDASKRPTKSGTGRFEPVDRLDLILLGDVFDLVRSSVWHEVDGLGPWSDPARTAGVVERITDRIIEHNQEALEHLRQLQGMLTYQLPGSTQLEAVPVHIHYFVGNHDWFYFNEGPEWDRIRSKVVKAMGLANDWRHPFPHMPEHAEDSAQRALFDHHVFAHHGDRFDPMNYDGERGRRASSLGDCIVLELVNRYPLALGRRLGVERDHGLVRILKDVDNVRPLLAIPDWVDGVLRRFTQDSMRAEATRVWDDLVDRFLEIDFVRSVQAARRRKPFDGLGLGLRLTRGWSLDNMLRIARSAERFMPRRDVYMRHALREPALESGDVDFIVYGHTHIPRVVPLDIRQTQDGFREQIYFNSGTWRRVYERCVGDDRAHEFGAFNMMTFITFYKDDERKGKRYETWTGHLG